MKELMMNSLKLVEKYKEVISYLFFGVCTTIVNIVVYFISARILGYSTITSTVTAFIVSVIFAYLTNKMWVFQSKTTTVEALIKEMLSFFGGRLFSGGCDLLVMYLFVDVLHFNDMIIKVLSNVMVVIMNYVISKLFVFKRGEVLDGESRGKQ